MTERTMLSLYVRSFSGWDRLREAVAGALGLPMAEVRGLMEEADPAVRLQALASVMGFRLRVELYIDSKRARVPAVEALAGELARRLSEDVAHHDGSNNPYTYVLVRPSGERFLVEESVDDSEADGLLLDEDPGRMQPILPKETPPGVRREKSSTLCVASATAGRCGGCRHSNQGTADAAEGHVFCSWGGGARTPSTPCDREITLPLDISADAPFAPYFLYESYDGRNGTWGRREDTRLLAPDASPALRASLRADEPFLPAEG